LERLVFDLTKEPRISKAEPETQYAMEY
jgi:hypothetical protein